MADEKDQTQNGSSLEPLDRLSELMFGLIISIAFIATISFQGDGIEDPKVVLVAAAVLTLSWSLIDAVMYLVYAVGERGANRRLLRRLRRTDSDEAAAQVLANALPESIADALPQALLIEIAADLRHAESLAAPKPLTRQDFRAAAEIFALEFVAMIPVLTPFFVISSARMALAVSLSIAVTMLALVGYFFGRNSGYRPLLTATMVVVLGLALAGVAWLAEG